MLARLHALGISLFYYSAVTLVLIYAAFFSCFMVLFFGRVKIVSRGVTALPNRYLVL